jgi:hypothetical protein
VPGFEDLSWHGLFAPADAPPEIAARPRRPWPTRTCRRFRGPGTTPVGDPPEEFRAFAAGATRR